MKELNYVQRDENRLQARSRGEDFFTPAPVERRKTPWDLVGVDPTEDLTEYDYSLFHRAVTEGFGIPGGLQPSSSPPGDDPGESGEG